VNSRKVMLNPQKSSVFNNTKGDVATPEEMKIGSRKFLADGESKCY